jgi:hypothetical protein
MSDKTPHDQPILALKPAWRRAAALTMVVLAFAHVLFPALAIDAVFLGLLAFAAFISFFDIQSIEWQGIKASRKQVEEARRNLKAGKKALPVSPPKPPADDAAPDALEGQSENPEAWAEDTDGPPSGILERQAEAVWRECVFLAGAAGRLPRIPMDHIATPTLLDLLEPHGALPPYVITAARIFWDRYLEAQRASGARRDQLISMALSLGHELIEQLRAVPRSLAIVVEARVPLFKDKNLEIPLSTPGFMLRIIDETGTETTRSVYPTAMTYEPRRLVAWEWNLGTIVQGPAWYEDPETNKPKQAFSKAAMFIGRQYPREWGFERRYGL